MLEITTEKYTKSKCICDLQHLYLIFLYYFFYIKTYFPNNITLGIFEKTLLHLMYNFINYSDVDICLSPCTSRSLVKLNTNNLACWITGCYDLYMTQSNQVTKPARFFSQSKPIVFLLNIKFNHILFLLVLRNLVNTLCIG